MYKIHKDSVIREPQLILELWSPAPHLSEKKLPICETKSVCETICKLARNKSLGYAQVVPRPDPELPVLVPVGAGPGGRALPRPVRPEIWHALHRRVARLRVLPLSTCSVLVRFWFQTTTIPWALIASMTLSASSGVILFNLVVRVLDLALSRAIFHHQRTLQFMARGD